MKYLLLALLTASYGFACRQLEVPLTNAIGAMIFVGIVCVVFLLTPSRKPTYKPRYRLPKSRSTSTLTW